jgi:hypothetical protein
MSRASPGGRLAFAAAAAISAGLLFLHVWLNVDPRLLYHRQGPLFFTGWGFFREHLGRPGGLVDYASALLAQFHWLGWPGAAVMAALALAIAVLMRAILGRLGRRWTWPALVPLALLAALANRFDHPLATWVGLAAVLAVTAAYVWAPPRRAPARAALFMALAALTYYAAGAAMFVFAIIAAVRELGSADVRRVSRHGKSSTFGTPLDDVQPVAVQSALRKEFTRRGGQSAIGTVSRHGESSTRPAAHQLALARIAFASVCLAWAAAVPYAAGWFFEMPTREAYTCGLAFMLAHDTVTLVASIGLYAVPVLAAAAAALWPRRGEVPPARPWLWRIVGAGAAAAVLAGGAVLALGSLDPAERSFLRIDWCTQEGRWADVLAEAAARPQPGAFVRQDVVLALFHSGRLLDDLFSYPLPPQEAEPAPSLTAFSRSTAYARTCERMLEFGRVGEAEHAAYEALETLGERPEILRHIVLIDILKGQPEAARPVLGLLEKTLWHAAWARQCRARLAADPALGDDDRVRRLRALLSSTDLAGDPTPETTLVEPLRANPQNRMAAEYLMVLYLTARRSEYVADNLLRLRQAGMTELPRHVQEAVVHVAWHRRDQPIRLYGFSLAPALREGYPRFAARLEPYAKDPAGAWNALRNDYGSTYWFYYTFGCTPFGRQGPPPAREAPK